MSMGGLLILRAEIETRQRDRLNDRRVERAHPECHFTQVPQSKHDNFIYGSQCLEIISVSVSFMSEETINIQEFLTICDRHRSIIRSFGIDAACNKKAAICKKGCLENQHKVNNCKHQFIPAKQLYIKLEKVRQEYRDFASKFAKQYLSTFVKQVKDSLQKFQKYITTEYSKQHPLIQNFCRFNNFYSQNLFEMIQQKLDDIQISQLNCKEVNSLIKLADFIEKQDRSARENRIYLQFQCLLDFYLKRQKLLPVSKNNEVKDKSPDVLDVEKFDALAAKLDKSANNYAIAKVSDHRLIEDLFINIHQDFGAVIEAYKVNPTIYPNLHTVVDVLMESLSNYITIIQPASIIFSIKSNTEQNMFWDKLFKVLTAKKIVKKLKIITSKDSQSQYIKKITQLYHSSYLQTEISTNINWQEQDNGISENEVSSVINNAQIKQ